MTRWLTAGTSACLIAFTACADPVDPLAGSADCSKRGRIYSGATSSSVWRASASPHVLLDSVVVTGKLVIEPGALVCGMPGASITADTIVAVGTESRPIGFAAARTEAWSGLRPRTSATLVHVRIEDTHTAVGKVPGTADILIEDSEIHRTAWTTLYGRLVTVRRTLVNESCSDTDLPWCAALMSSYSSLTLEQVIVRASGAIGVQTGNRCALNLNDVTIEGSAGVGLEAVYNIGTACSVNVGGPVFITGGASYPLDISGSYALPWLQPEWAARLTGNARDTILLRTIALAQDTVHIHDVMPVSFTDCDGYWGGGRSPLKDVVLGPGSHVTLTAGCRWHMDLVARGTPAQPVTIAGENDVIINWADPGDTLRLQHVNLSNVTLRLNEGFAILQDVRMDNASLDVTAESRIENLRATGSARPVLISPAFEQDTMEFATVTLRASATLHGVDISSAWRNAIRSVADASIRSCTLSGNPGHGLFVETGSVSVRECNLTGNARSGVMNAGSFPVDAVDNWWGDAAGPLGPNGDGVEGSVNYTPWRTEPVTWSSSGITAAFSRRSRR